MRDALESQRPGIRHLLERLYKGEEAREATKARAMVCVSGYHIHPLVFLGSLSRGMLRGNQGGIRDQSGFPVHEPSRRATARTVTLYGVKSVISDTKDDQGS